MGITRYKQILGIQIHEHILGQLLKDMEEYGDYSPFIVDESGHLRYADDWQAEKERDLDSKVIEIEKVYADGVLEEEISNVGMDDTFTKYDWRPLLEKLEIDRVGQPRSIDNYRIVVEIVYRCYDDYYSGGTDCDSDIEVLGYLDSDLQLQTINNKADAGT